MKDQTRTEITTDQIQSIAGKTCIPTHFANEIAEIANSKGTELATYQLTCHKFQNDAGIRKGLTRSQAIRIQYAMATGNVVSRVPSNVKDFVGISTLKSVADFINAFTTTTEDAPEASSTTEKEATTMTEQEMNVESTKYNEYKTERLEIFETLITAGAKPETLETMSEAFNLMSEGDAEKMMGFWREAASLI